MPEEKITLDREAFKSLASDTRVSILKSLNSRRKMLAELSKELKMSPSTVKEHMDSLRKAGLVELKDDGHKWKYYELTRKGKNVLNPGEARVWILLCLSGLAFLVTAYDMLSSSISSTFSRDALMNTKDVLTTGAQDAAAEAASAVTPMVAPIAQISYIHIAGLVLFMAVFAVTLGYYLGSRKKFSLDL
jgi:DNA-binding transcriptional ArsR family regulator